MTLEHLHGKKCPLRLKKAPQDGDLLPGVIFTKSPGLEKASLMVAVKQLM